MKRYTEIDIMRVLDTGGVLRFHAFPGITGNDLGNHQWGVALIAQHLMPEGSKNLLLRCLTHDCAERVTGDIPSMFKQAIAEETSFIKEVEEFNEETMGVRLPGLFLKEMKVLAYADSLEGMHHSAQRYLMGEKQALRCFANWRDSVTQRVKDDPDFELGEKVTQLMKDLQRLIESDRGFQYE